MNKLVQKILRPLFMAAARPGIIGPHAEAEADLLLAGAKPLGVFWRGIFKEDIARLEEAAAKGGLIKGEFTRTTQQAFHLYCAPGKESEALRLLSNYWTCRHKDSSGFSLSEAEKKLLSEYFERIHESSPENLRSCKNALETIHKDSHLGFSFVSGTYLPPDIQTMLDDAARQGELIHKEVIIDGGDEHFVIFGQPGQQENMRKLALTMQLYFINNLPPDEYNALTEGALYGFSDNDLKRWRDGYEEMGRMRAIFLEQTNGLRRWCRHQVMKTDGPDWQRNP